MEGRFGSRGLPISPFARLPLARREPLASRVTSIYSRLRSNAIREPATNHVWIDINSGASNHLLLLSNGDQVTSLGQSIGPASDKRKAARPDGAYNEFSGSPTTTSACRATHRTR